MLKFTILFDNYKFEDSLKPLWGFSCLVEVDNQSILFDVGSNGRILLQNAKKMGISFKDIDKVFISHNHWDHIGGLDTIIEENPNIKLILPNTISNHYINDLRKMVKEVHIVEDFEILTANFYTTGMIKSKESSETEQALIIDYNDELYILSGCGHMGILNLLNSIHIKKPIKYLGGGFHLLYKTPIEIKEIISKLNVEYVTATHCSGETAIGMLKLKYKEKFLAGGVGAKIIFDK